MERKHRNILIWGIITTLIIFLGTIYYFYTHPITNEVDALAACKFRFEVLKTIGIGFLLAFLSIVVPQLLASAKYDFEQKIEGRRLYSIAKTGLSYLAQRMAVMEYEEAMKHLESIHQAYHLVVLYPDSDDPNIGNYKQYFAKYKIHRLREIFSELLHNPDYKKSDILTRIQMIDETWNNLDKKK